MGFPKALFPRLRVQRYGEFSIHASVSTKNFAILLNFSTILDIGQNASRAYIYYIYMYSARTWQKAYRKRHGENDTDCRGQIRNGHEAINVADVRR